MKIWMINNYCMPPELGHFNRHYYFAKYLKRMGHEPYVFTASYLHNHAQQMIEDKSEYIFYDKQDFSFVFVRTSSYGNSRVKQVMAMFEFYFRMLNGKQFAK